MDITHLAARAQEAPDSPSQRLLRRVEAEELQRQQIAQRNTALGRVAFGITLLATWELASGPILDQFFVSKPSHIAAALWDMLVKETLLYHLQFTILEAVSGYLIGAGAGLVLGFVLARLDLVYRIGEPFVVAF